MSLRTIFIWRCLARMTQYEFPQFVIHSLLGGFLGAMVAAPFHSFVGAVGGAACGGFVVTFVRPNEGELQISGAAPRNLRCAVPFAALGMHLGVLITLLCGVLPILILCMGFVFVLGVPYDYFFLLVFGSAYILLPPIGLMTGQYIGQHVRQRTTYGEPWLRRTLCVGASWGCVLGVASGAFAGFMYLVIAESPRYSPTEQIGHAILTGAAGGEIAGMLAAYFIGRRTVRHLPSTEWHFIRSRLCAGLILGLFLGLLASGNYLRHNPEFPGNIKDLFTVSTCLAFWLPVGLFTGSVLSTAPLFVRELWRKRVEQSLNAEIVP